MMHGVEMWMGGLVGLVMIGLLIWLIVRSVTSNSPSNSGRDINDALEILRWRLTRGEIGEQEFEEKRQLLEK